MVCSGGILYQDFGVSGPAGVLPLSHSESVCACESE